MGVQGGDISATLTLALNFAPVGTFGARMMLQGGMPVDVTVTPVAGGAHTYTVRLAMNNSAFSDLYTGTAQMQLCADNNCVAKQAVAEVDVPYVIDVLPPGTTWPGDHLTALSAWPGVSEWSTFQGNAAHTGLVPVTIDATKISPRWRLMGTGDTISDYNRYPQTVTTGAGRFFQSGPHTVYARSEFDGSLQWQYDFTQDKLQYPSANPPAVYGGVVYVAAGQQSSTWFYGLDATTGTMRFRSPMASQWDHYLAPTMGPSGIYEEAGEYGGLYAFDPSTGAQRFYDDIPTSANMWTPAVDADGLYYYGRGQFLAFDPASGAPLASIDDPAGASNGYGIVGSPVAGSAGLVYAATYEDSIVDGGSRGNRLVAFDVPGGRIAWELSGNFPSTPAYGSGSLILPNENPYRIESRAGFDGTVAWTWVPPPEAGTHFRSEVLLTNNLFFVSTDTTTYAVDLTTHQTVWSFPMSGHLALSASGVFYIQNPLLICTFTVK